MAPASTILGRIRNKLKIEQNPAPPELQDTSLLSYLNYAVINYHETFKEGGGEPSSILMSEEGFTVVADSDLNGAVADGASTITLTDSSSFGTSGAVAIWDNERSDYVEFSDNTANVLTTTGVSFAHEDGDTVSLLYALPSDFADFRTTEEDPTGVSLDGRPLFFTSGSPYANKFTIYDNGTTKFMHLPRSSSGDLFIRYNKNPTTVDDLNDTVDIPTKDELYAINYVVAQVGHLAPIRLEDVQMADIKWREVLRKSTRNRNIGRRIRPRPMTRTRFYNNNPDYRA